MNKVNVLGFFYRLITDGEIRVIKRELEHYMNCEFEKMPIEMFLSQTITYSGQKWSNYKNCINSQTHQRIPDHYRQCQSLLPTNCTRNAAVAMANHCDWYKYEAERNAGYTSVWDYFEKPGSLENSSHTYMQNGFKNYVDCIHSRKIETAVRNCIPIVKKQCLSSSVIAAKVLRVHMWDFMSSLYEHPEWKVVHQIRDPRGVLMSQRATGILTRYSKGSIIAESSILCDKMLNDSQAFRLYNSTYPGQLLQVKYEDYADAPVQTVAKIYSHIGENVHPNVIKEIIDLTSAKRDTGSMDQHRVNSSSTARKWTEKMTSLEKKYIDVSCRNFYKETGYPEFVKLRTKLRSEDHSSARESREKVAGKVRDTQRNGSLPKLHPHFSNSSAKHLRSRHNIYRRKSGIKQLP